MVINENGLTALHRDVLQVQVVADLLLKIHTSKD
jgi:hypothetical protein